MLENEIGQVNNVEELKTRSKKHNEDNINYRNIHRKDTRYGDYNYFKSCNNKWRTYIKDFE